MKLNGKSRRSTNLFRRSPYQKLIFSGMKIFYHDSAVNNRRIKLKAKTVVKKILPKADRGFFMIAFFSVDSCIKRRKNFHLKDSFLPVKIS